MKVTGVVVVTPLTTANAVVVFRQPVHGRDDPGKDEGIDGKLSSGLFGVDEPLVGSNVTTKPGSVPPESGNVMSLIVIVIFPTLGEVPKTVVSTLTRLVPSVSSA